MLSDLIPVRQHLGGPVVADVQLAMVAALRQLDLGSRIRPGMTVGIPVGSRGIRHIALLVREAVRHIRLLGASPLVVTCMGSHGGATAEGQVAVLESLGISPSTVEASVQGNIEAVEVARTASGVPVYFDRVLAGCDAILVLNRVKPHTSFHGPLESGLVKMLVVGCGKPVGARQFHSLGAAELAARLLEFGGIILSHMPVVGGVAVLENGREETADLVPVPAEALITLEQQLLQRALAMQPCLPVDELDLLVVDQMGKDISGTGMDTNIIGRMGIRGMPDSGPHVRRLVVLDLSPGSHGNANGVGLADLVTRRLADKIDFAATYMNTLTATFVERARLPITLDSDRAVVETALQTIGSPVEPRIIRIHNTLELEEMLVSPAILRQAPSLEVLGPAGPWGFDAHGNLF